MTGATLSPVVSTTALKAWVAAIARVTASAKRVADKTNSAHHATFSRLAMGRSLSEREPQIQLAGGDTAIGAAERSNPPYTLQSVKTKVAKAVNEEQKAHLSSFSEILS